MASSLDSKIQKTLEEIDQLLEELGDSIVSLNSALRKDNKEPVPEEI